MEKGIVIFLNGTTSSGKTTLARYLLEKLPAQYHYLSVDTFMQMDPEWYLEQAFQQSIAYLSDRGIHTIVDYVLLDTPIGKSLFEECLELLDNHPVLFVRVDCPLEELERRERERGDRSPGQAKWQFEHIHAHGTYDLTLNTYEMTVQACADAILAKLDRPQDWKAFSILKSQLGYERYHGAEVTISEHAANSDLNLIRRSLQREYFETSGGPAEMPEGKMHLIARDPDGQIIGGILCETFLKSLRVQTLWVDEPHRNQGIGSRLLRAAEQSALHSGCTFAHSQVFSFADRVEGGKPHLKGRALEFFKRRGFSVYAMLDEFDDGIVCYQLKKRLSPASTK